MDPILAISRMVLKEIFRKKDFYVALILIFVVLFYASQLNFYNTEKISFYLMEIGLLLMFLFSAFLTSSLAARQFPSEIQNRTASVLLAKPVSRQQFVVGKFLGVLWASWATFSIFFILFIAIVSLKAGKLTPLMITAQSYYLFLLCLMVIAAMTSAFSYFLTTSANITLSMILYVLINTYGANLKTSGESMMLASRVLAEILYFSLPHFEFFDLRQRFIHEWPPLSLPLLLFLTLYACVYTAFFLSLGKVLLQKKTIG